MPGYRRRRTWRVRRAAKYSIQQKALQFAAAQGQTTTVAVVPSTVVEGMRKVKHITVNATVQGESDAFYWAIVYVPQGTTLMQFKFQQVQLLQGCMSLISLS